VVWLAGLVVVVAAGAATAHGLYEVALGSGTPAGIAWLYPVITDGLALVAYAATTRLAGSGRRYAWTVVVVAAGLSGLAQATYLAGTVGAAPTGLRFGVGAWPAVAAATAAHLLFLIGTTPTDQSALDAQVSTEPEAIDADVSTAPGAGPAAGDPSNGRPGPVQAVPSHTSQDPLPFAMNGSPTRAALPTGLDVGRTEGLRRALSQSDRARAVAELHSARTGALPTVRELAEMADVGRGTAARELAALRERSNGLHVVTDLTPERPEQ
jgi:hypothetical protein